MRFGKPRNILPSGFALIEVMVSLAILAIGLVAVLTAVLSALNLQKDSANRFRAGLILQEKLSEITMVQYNGRTMHGVSPDSLFSWSVRGAPWAGAPPELPDAKGRTAAADTLVNPVFEVEVDVSWWTTRGTRTLSATQLVRVFSDMETLR
ncbi:MAG: prepilin-type N-terminal cleavage/methylation domain-containing protein [Gemmatimonadales bacterium]|nr:prepilin-type N-terminal cleavage/methylation domain-containing protein [Gemmatimonadales bacterium]